MNYREYLQKQLGGIRDIEERKGARELLLEGFLALYTLADCTHGSFGAVY